MNPDKPQTAPVEPQLNQDRLDEQACGERINYWLKKFACTLQGQCQLTNGNVQILVGVVKIPLEIRKQLKEAEKRGTPVDMGQSPPATSPDPDIKG
jgi:hypothetical protein